VGENPSLPLSKLLQKSLMLLALASACRVSELAMLSRKIKVVNGGWVFFFQNWKKNSTKKNAKTELEVGFFEDPLLCPLRGLEVYLKATGGYAQEVIFLTMVHPVHAARPNTLAKHLKLVLGAAGISSTAHSCRSASTSKALVKGVPIETILNRTGKGRNVM
jgi:hypothetical protein